MPWKCTKNLSAPIKWMLNFFNAAMIGAGVFVIYHVCKLFNVLPTEYISYMFITSVLIFICGLLGFVATLSENVPITKAYAAIMIVSIIVQVIGICLVKKFDRLIRVTAKNTVKKQWLEEQEHPGAMDGLQIRFKCCGNESSKDYINILHRPKIPNSCYTSNFKVLNTEGCFTGAEKSITNSFAVSARADWVSLLLTSILFVAVVYLVIYFTNKKRRENCQN